MIKLLHVRTNYQVGGLLIKALGSQQFFSLLGKMNMVNIHSFLPLEGEYLKV